MSLWQWHISAGQNEALKKYSIEMLPAVMAHLEMAKQQYALLTMGAGGPVDGHGLCSNEQGPCRFNR